MEALTPSADMKLPMLSDTQRARYRQITTLDAHTEGEPLRIITSGYPSVQGSFMLAKRRYLQAHLDDYRKLLMFEPRGHADMYGALITEPVSAWLDLGGFGWVCVALWRTVPKLLE